MFVIKNRAIPINTYYTGLRKEDQIKNASIKLKNVTSNNASNHRHEHHPFDQISESVIVSDYPERGPATQLKQTGNVHYKIPNKK